MFDRENMFSDKQALAASADSTDVVHVGEGDAGPGAPLMLEVDAAPSAGATALTVTVKTADTDDMAGAVTLATFTVDPAMLAKGGPILVAAIPPGCKRFLRLNFTVAGTPSGLAVSAGIVMQGQTSTLPK